MGSEGYEGGSGGTFFTKTGCMESVLVAGSDPRPQVLRKGSLRGEGVGKDLTWDEQAQWRAQVPMSGTPGT